MPRPKTRQFTEALERIALDPAHTASERIAALAHLTTLAKLRFEERRLKRQTQPGPASGSPVQPNQAEQAALNRLSALAASLQENGEI